MRDFGPGVPEATAPAIDRMRFQEEMAALTEAIRRIAAARHRRGQRPLRRRRLRAVPGRRHQNLFADGVVRQRRHPARALRRRDGHELPPAAHRRHQRRRRLDAHRPHGVGRRSRSPRPGQRGRRTRWSDRPRRGVGFADRRSCPAGRAADQARPAGQHRRDEPRVGAGTGEPQPGALARDRRRGRNAARSGLRDEAEPAPD